MARRDLPCGIYAPTMTFFDPETEDLDLPTIKKHAQRLIRHGLVGLVVMGSNGEAVHCTREEKMAVARATREALDEAEALQTLLSRADWPLTKASIAGTKQAIQMHHGYGGHPRRPLKRLDQATFNAIQEGIQEAMEVERSL
ncbi:hypothetical protein E4U41_005922 [Claviceps citrina]|nr:hypothetical protein E4U41_005922 [Claviceps citrina]